ncbi:MAG: hypothetical protein GC192_01560 [Bacteroidetes bacterium]|nr:hypothetical protein [Bacteroidota bacterium]
METFQKYFRFYLACLGIVYIIKFLMLKVYGDPIPENLFIEGTVFFVILSIADYINQKRKAKQLANA